MNVSSMARIETLSKENWDTWKMQMKVWLVKNDAVYNNGNSSKPVVIEKSEKELELCLKNNAKAKSDIVLSTDWKKIKSCTSSHVLWLKLKNIYESKVSARKATLPKQLTLQRLLEVEVDVIMLYSLPSSHENVRCATIELKDELPTPDTLCIKIIEESGPQQNENRTRMLNAMFAIKKCNKWRYQKESVA